MMARMTMWTRALLASLLLMLLLFNVNAQAQTQAKGSAADVVAQPLRVPPPPPPEEDPPYNYASMYDQSVPTTMTAGAVYTVTVRMLNAGTTAWTSAASYSLGSSNPLNNGTWGGGRVPLPNTIYPGQVATFTFNVTAPAAAGSYNFQWAMVQDGVEWFGVASTNLVVNVVAPARVNGAVIVAQSVPAQMTTGQSYPVTMVMQNTGNTTWTSADQYSFGLPTVNGVQLWNGGRVPLPGAVPPGGQAAFNFTVTAPAPGSYSFFGLMVQDGVEFFGQGSSIPVNVSAPAPVNGSQVIGISVPPLTSGQVANISVTLQNTGNTTWAAGSNYKLGSKNPDENTIWGVARVELAANVAPGQQYTFTFPITAPAAGTYTMQWQMMERYVQWFGGLASASVPVSASPSSDNVVYIHTDALGSPVARSDSAGNVISRTSYESYGRTASGATPTIGFTGHVNDADTGLVYMQQRYYDPVAGRFLSVDPVVTDTSTGSIFNRYAYANNSPYKYSDPDGRLACADMGGNCHTVNFISSAGGGGGGGGPTNGSAPPSSPNSNSTSSQPYLYEPGSQTEINIAGDPVNSNYPGVGVAQVIVGGTLVAGVGVAGAEGAAFIGSRLYANSLKGLELEELKAIVKAEGGVAQLNTKGIFGTGVPGGISALAVAQRAAPYSLPLGLQVNALHAYRVIATRSINEVQSLRIKIIDQYLKIMGR